MINLNENFKLEVILPCTFDDIVYDFINKLKVDSFEIHKGDIWIRTIKINEVDTDSENFIYLNLKDINKTWFTNIKNMPEQYRNNFIEVK